MRIGVPKEIKDNEFRVGLVPATVAQLSAHGHDVLVETQAGAGAGIADDDYRKAGAAVLARAADIFAQAELIVKVKEPLPAELPLLRRGQALFTYLHLAPDPDLTKALLASGVTAIAYETVTDEAGGLPLLAPMSQVAGRLAPQIGAHYLERPQGGRGVLLGGVSGVAPAKVLIVGAGNVGANAALIAAGMQAEVTVAARSAKSLRRIETQLGAGVKTVRSGHDVIQDLTRAADLVICTALVPGAAAAKLVSESMVKAMKPGSVIVDVSIDQGGNAETSRPTSHSHPTYVTHGVTHYCVTNMPGAVPRTSTFALDNATRPFVLELADKGIARALADNPHLRNGLNVQGGHLTCRAVAEATGLPYAEPHR